MDGDKQHDEFIEQTLEIWESRCDRILTREDAREVIANVAGFFHLLLRWNLEEQARPDTGNSHELGPVEVDDAA